MPPMKFFVEGLTPELVKKAEVELGETEETKAQGLKELRRLIKEEPDFFPCDEDFFLLRFLRVRKYNVERAFKTLKNFYVHKATYSGIMTEFELHEMKHVIEQNNVMNFEFRDANNGGIGFGRLGYYDINKTSLDEIFACILLLAEIAYNVEATQVAGYSVIIDFSNFTLFKMRHWASPTFMYRAISTIQDVIPCRINGYHVVNEPLYFSILFNVMKTFMSEKLSKRFYCHGTNRKSLFKFFSPDILPEELGGKLGTIESNVEKYKKHVYPMANHIKKLNKYGYQGETLRKLTKDNDKARLT